MLKVTHLSTTCEGGAGGAAYRIHEILLASGVDSTLLIQNKTNTSKFKNVYSYKTKNTLLKRIKNKLINLLISNFINNKYLFMGLTDKPSLNVKKWLHKNIPEDTNLIMVHWVAGFIKLNDLYDVVDLQKTNVCIVMMDMAMITGGCHYSFGCEQYKTQCYLCPATNNSIISKHISEQFFEKSIYVKKLNASILSWTGFGIKQAKQAAIPFSDYVFIKPPVDKDIFYYRKRDISSNNNKYILMGAYNKNDKRKGYLTFVLAITKLSKYLKINNKNITILVPSEGEFDELINPNVNIEKYNFAKTNEELASIYQQADLFVNTSIDDTGPLMVIEALFCGVPVVATKTGVSQELLVENSFAGKIVDIQDYDDLQKSIQECLFGDVPVYPSTLIEQSVKQHYHSALNYVDTIKKLSCLDG